MLLEREPELAVLERAVHDVVAGTGAVVAISGAAGTGATALLRQLAVIGGRHGARVLRASGAQIEREFPLGVVRQLALPLLTGPEDSAVLPIARTMLSALTGTVDHAPAPEPPVLWTVLHGLHTMLVGLGATQPVVVLVDDLHWVDQQSLRALAFLTARLSGLRALIGVVLADGAGARDPLIAEITKAARVRVRAEPLSPEATAKLVAGQFGTGHDAEFAQACHEVTGGHPKEVRTLLGRAFSHRLRGRADEIPRIRTLGGSFRQERLLFLLRRDPAVEAFAKAAVVLGRQADPQLVARLGGVGPAGCAAARAVLGGHWLTITPERVAIRDPSMVRVVEETMSAAESASLHRAAAELLTERGFPPEDVAEQLLLVDTIEDSWEVDQLRAAAVSARRRGELEPATRYLRRALLDVPPGCPQRARLLVELAAAELDLDPGSAIRHLAQAAPLMPTERDRATVVAWIPLAVAGSAPQVTELVRDVAEHLGPAGKLEGHERELALRLEARIWFAGLDEPGTLAGGAARLTDLGTDARGASAAERELRVVLLHAATLTGRASHAEIARGARDVLEHEPANSVQARSALQILPSVLLAADAAGYALPWLDAAHHNVSRHCTAAILAQVEAQQALSLLSLGRLVEAKDFAVRAFDAADPDWQGALVLPSVALGSVAFALRDRVLATRVLDVPAGAGDLRLFAVRRSLRGALAAGAGDLAGALAQFLDCGRRLDRAGWQNPVLYSWRSSAAVLSQRLGRGAQAVRLAEENFRLSETWGAPTAISRALRVRAAVQPGDEGIALLREALEFLQDKENPLEQAKVLLQLARRLRDGEPAEGERLATHGYRLAEQCGASWLGARADGLFGGAEPPLVVPGGRPELTRRETTVAELAARGRTNAEIADQLGTSRRAVEKHLTNSYRKLRIDGRPDLAGALGLGGVAS